MEKHYFVEKGRVTFGFIVWKKFLTIAIQVFNARGFRALVLTERGIKFENRIIRR